MHSRALLIAFLAPLLALGTSCSESAPTAAPEEASSPSATPESPPVPDSHFTFDRERHDFGNVYQAAVRETTFELVAAGTAPTVVTELKRSCGCTEGELFVLDEAGQTSPVALDHPYPPGTRFQLLAKLNTKGRQGTQEQRVHVVTEGNQTTTFLLDAEIVTFLELEPPSLELPNASALSGLESSLVLKSRGGEPFSVDARREVLSEDLELEFTPIEPDAEGRSDRWTLAFRIVPGAPVGPYKRKVILVTDAVNAEAEPFSDGSPATHLGEVWIRTEVEGVFEVRPERLNFGRMLPGQRVTKKILVKNRDPEFALEDIQIALFERAGGLFAHTEAFEVSARATDPGRVWEIEVAAQDVPSAGPFSGILGIRVDHPFQEDIQIQFTGQAVEPSN